MKSAIPNPKSQIRKFDLAQLWNHYTSLGFVFAMWMTKLDEIAIDFPAARDEGLEHVDAIVANYESEIGLSADEMRRYLTQNISYAVDESMIAGMDLYFRLAGKCGLINKVKPVVYLE